MKMELRQLRYFVAVAEELSFRRAAVKVHISQPPLSRQIVMLEKELGVRLLERSKHHVSLTPTGVIFLEHARTVIAAAETAVVAAERAARGEIGRLRIGFIGSAIFSCLPGVLGAYAKQHPGVELALQPLTIAEQVEALHAGRIDIGFIRQPVLSEGIATVSLLREPFMLALPARHALSKRQFVPVRELANERFVIFRREEGLGAYNEIVSICQEAGFTPRIAQETGPMTTVIGLVGSGIGIAIVPATTQRIHIDEVIYRPLSGTSAMAEFALAFRAEDPSPVLAQFVAIAAQTMGMAEAIKLQAKAALTAAAHAALAAYDDGSRERGRAPRKIADRSSKPRKVAAAGAARKAPLKPTRR
jgi:DNA-binding transcriptional LysR family regulator